MKILMKILFAPIIAVLAIFTWLALQLVKVSAVVLNFIAILLALGSLCLIWDGSTVQGIAGLVVAFLLSPFGLPTFSVILLGQVQRFRYWIQNSVYD